MVSTPVLIVLRRNLRLAGEDGVSIENILGMLNATRMEMVEPPLPVIVSTWAVLDNALILPLLLVHHIHRKISPIARIIRRAQVEIIALTGLIILPLPNIRARSNTTQCANILRNRALWLRVIPSSVAIEQPVVAFLQARPELQLVRLMELVVVATPDHQETAGGGIDQRTVVLEIE